MKKVVTYILLTFYLILVFFVTAYILSFDKYGVARFNNISIICASDEKVVPSGSLIIAKKTDDIKTNDKILYYDTYSTKVKIDMQTVKKIKKINSAETTYTLKDGHLLSNKHVLASKKNIKSVPYIGKILSILSSQLGYLIFFVLPILFYLIYLVHSLREELRKSRKLENDEEIKN